MVGLVTRKSQITHIGDPWSLIYSQTFCKRPPKMSSLGGRLWEVVAYESLDHIELKFGLIKMW